MMSLNLSQVELLNCNNVLGHVEDYSYIAMADPGFPRRGANPYGASTYYLTNFPQKLHETEEIFGGGGVFHAPHRSTNVQ